MLCKIRVQNSRAKIAKNRFIWGTRLSATVHFQIPCFERVHIYLWTFTLLKQHHTSALPLIGVGGKVSGMDPILSASADAVLSVYIYIFGLLPCSNSTNMCSSEHGKSPKIYMYARKTNIFRWGLHPPLSNFNHRPQLKGARSWGSNCGWFSSLNIFYL